MVAAVLFRSSVQFYRQHPLQLLLGIAGIVLGVGIVTAVLITNSSSKRAFALSTEALYGRTTHYIVGADGIDQQYYPQLRKQFPHLVVAPVVEGFVTLDNTVLSLLGLDPFAELPLERFGKRQPQTDLPVIKSNGLLLSKASAEQLGVHQDELLTLKTNNGNTRIALSGLLTSNNPAASKGLLIGDIALVQSVLNRGNRIDRIDLIASAAEAAAVAATLPPTLKLSNAASRQATMLAMTRGFQINLTAMSLLSLLVGAFLIHNTMSFAVLQRRELFAVKRTIGIASRSLFLSVVLEALLISLVGSFIGVLCGRVLAQQLIKLTTQTINDLYFVLHVQEIWFSPAVFLLGMALGIGTSVLAASLSASEAAKVSPVQSKQRSQTETRTRLWLPILAYSGTVCMLFGIAVATTKTLSLLAGFIALILFIVGYGLLIPGASFAVSKVINQLLSGVSPILSMAAGSVERNISRTGLAIAALTVAVASTFGVDVMIGSFRGSVDDWLKNTLQSDVYLSMPSTVSTSTGAVLDRALLKQIKENELVVSISTGLKIQTRTALGEFETLALEPHNNEAIGLTFISENKSIAWKRFLHDQAILLSEPLATKYSLKPGDSLSVFTEKEGDREFRIAGIVRDYTSSHGQITMHRQTFNRYWNSAEHSTIGIIYHDNVDTDVANNALQSNLQTLATPVRLQANSDIHRDSLAIFDRTFEVTKVLRWLTVGVAFVGIFSALLALNLERAKEFAVLRATGSTRTQLFALIGFQTLWMGLLAGLMALPLGWVMAKILIHVINLRSFGWSMQSFIPSGSVMATLTLACGSALLAGIYPAWRLGRSTIAAQLRQE